MSAAAYNRGSQLVSREAWADICLFRDGIASDRAVIDSLAGFEVAVREHQTEFLKESKMSHPLVEILDDIQEEYELDLESTREESDITRLIDKREARKVAAFEARDLAVAKAVRYACEDVADSEREAIQNLDLEEIIKGVK